MFHSFAVLPRSCCLQSSQVGTVFVWNFPVALPYQFAYQLRPQVDWRRRRKQKLVRSQWRSTVEATPVPNHQEGAFPPLQY